MILGAATAEEPGGPADLEPKELERRRDDSDGSLDGEENALVGLEGAPARTLALGRGQHDFRLVFVCLCLLFGLAGVGASLMLLARVAKEAESLGPQNVAFVVFSF